MTLDPTLGENAVAASGQYRLAGDWPVVLPCAETFSRTTRDGLGLSEINGLPWTPIPLITEGNVVCDEGNGQAFWNLALPGAANDPIYALDLQGILSFPFEIVVTHAVFCEGIDPGDVLLPQINIGLSQLLATNSFGTFGTHIFGALAVQDNDSFEVFGYSTGVDSAEITDVLPTHPSNGEFFSTRILVNADGSAKIKVWADQREAEPTAWTVEWTSAISTGDLRYFWLAPWNSGSSQLTFSQYFIDQIVFEQGVDCEDTHCFVTGGDYAGGDSVFDDQFGRTIARQVGSHSDDPATWGGDWLVSFDADASATIGGAGVDGTAGYFATEIVGAGWNSFIGAVAPTTESPLAWTLEGRFRLTKSVTPDTSFFLEFGLGGGAVELQIDYSTVTSQFRVELFESYNPDPAVGFTGARADLAFASFVWGDWYRIKWEHVLTGGGALGGLARAKFWRESAGEPSDWLVVNEPESLTNEDDEISFGADMYSESSAPGSWVKVELDYLTQTGAVDFTYDCRPIAGSPTDCPGPIATGTDDMNRTVAATSTYGNHASWGTGTFGAWRITYEKDPSVSSSFKFIANPLAFSADGSSGVYATQSALPLPLPALDPGQSGWLQSDSIYLDTSPISSSQQLVTDNSMLDLGGAALNTPTDITMRHSFTTNSGLGGGGNVEWDISRFNRNVNSIEQNTFIQGQPDFYGHTYVSPGTWFRSGAEAFVTSGSLDRLLFYDQLEPNTTVSWWTRWIATENATYAKWWEDGEEEPDEWMGWAIRSSQPNTFSPNYLSWQGSITLGCVYRLDSIEIANPCGGGVVMTGHAVLDSEGDVGLR